MEEMRMFHIAICDDEIVVCTQLEKYLDRYINKGIVNTEVFYSADKLYEALSKGDLCDLIFMDIEFKASTGVEIIHKIRTELKNEIIRIVYISAKQSYAMELFATRPMNFLVKPILEQDVIDNVEKAMTLADMQDSYFVFKFGKNNYRIPYGDILCFESDNRKIHIYKGWRKRNVWPI